MMKKLILIIIYATLCSIPLLLLVGYFDIDKWWLNLLIYVFSFFNGSFVYTQIHGNKIIQLSHMDSDADEVTHNFKADLKASNHGAFRVTGKYIRQYLYTDKELSRKLFNKINAPSDSKSFIDFAQDDQSETLSVWVDDFESPFKVILINITKADFKQRVD